jgi:hypothetical protein
MFGRKTATADVPFVAQNETPELSALANSEIETALATVEVEVQKIPTGMTSKKAAAKKAREAKAAEKAAKSPTVSEAIAVIVAAATDTPKWSDYHDTTQATPVVAPDLPETAAAILSIAAPAPKAKKAATGTAAARKAALAAEGDKTGRLERVIALLSRPEGASLQDIQTCFWLAASAVRKMVEKAGYTTSQSGDRGSYRYHAKKA